MINKEIILSKLPTVLSGFFLFSCFFLNNLSISFSFMLLYSLIVFNQKNIKNIDLNLLTVLTLSFFLLTSLSYFYSENTSEFFLVLERRLPWLVIPIFFPLFFKKIDFKLFKQLFYWVILCSFFYNFISSYYLNVYGNIYSYFGSAYTYPVHPTYVSVYVNVALILLFYELIHGLKKNLFFIPICIVFILVASSKLAIILLFFNILIFSVLFIFKNGVSIKKIIFSLLLLASTVFLAFQNPIMNSKLAEVRHSIEASTTKPVAEKPVAKDPSYHPSSSNQRIIAWTTSITIIRQNPFLGVGSGDYLDCMVAEYQKQEEAFLQEKRLDSHQQFLQTFVELGLIPVLILISIFLFLVVKSWQNKSIILFMFASNFFIYGLTESFLERQAGLMFFLFFLFLFTDKKILNES